MWRRHDFVARSAGKLPPSEGDRKWAPVPGRQKAASSRRYERIREYVGGYRYILKCVGDTFRIKERRVLIDAHELGTLGSVSFIL